MTAEGQNRIRTRLKITAEGAKIMRHKEAQKRRTG